MASERSGPSDPEPEIAGRSSAVYEGEMAERGVESVADGEGMLRENVIRVDFLMKKRCGT
jgi:hypothetical protein